MAIISWQIWALCPIWSPWALVAHSVEHLRQQGCQGANQCRVGEDFQERSKERDQTHFILSCTYLFRWFVV